MESVWLPPGGGPATWVRTTHLGFLVPWLFSFENLDSGGWISLDFLGFSRPNRDLSIGYAAKTTKGFS
jgi:hypothetical protein